MRECADVQMCRFFNLILKDVYKVDRMGSVMWNELWQNRNPLCIKSKSVKVMDDILSIVGIGLYNY